MLSQSTMLIGWIEIAILYCLISVWTRIKRILGIYRIFHFL